MIRRHLRLMAIILAVLLFIAPVQAFAGSTSSGVVGSGVGGGMEGNTKPRLWWRISSSDDPHYRWTCPGSPYGQLYNKPDNVGRSLEKATNNQKNTNGTNGSRLIAYTCSSFNHGSKYTSDTQMTNWSVGKFIEFSDIHQNITGYGKRKEGLTDKYSECKPTCGCDWCAIYNWYNYGTSIYDFPSELRDPEKTGAKIEAWSEGPNHGGTFRYRIPKYIYDSSIKGTSPGTGPGWRFLRDNENANNAANKNDPVEKSGSKSVKLSWERGIIWKLKDGKYSVLTAIWVDPDLEVTPVDKSNTVTVITKISTTSRDANNNQQTTVTYNQNVPATDNGHQTELKSIYESNKNSGSYYHKTAPNHFSDDFKITVEYTTIKRTWTEIWQGSSLLRVENDHYAKTGSSKKEKTIYYKTTTPSIPKEYFTPVNLNRNGLAIQDDGLTAQYVSPQATGTIDASVDNKDGITNNTAIETLDINNVKTFYLKFGTDWFGLPDRKWKTSYSTTLANGTYENVNNGAPYANGRNNGSYSDGFTRYNLKLFASLTTHSTYSTSSLKPKGTTSELSGSQVFSPDIGYRGGDWETRFTYIGEYKTDNGQSGSKFPNYWVAKYSVRRFYEYGTEYSGLIDLSGIKNPNYIKYGTSNGAENPTITSNAASVSSPTRGFYVASAGEDVEQPIFCAKWNVRTIAGDIN